MRRPKKARDPPQNCGDLLAVVEAFKVILPLLGTLDWVLTLRHALGKVHPDGITATDLHSSQRNSGTWGHRWLASGEERGIYMRGVAPCHSIPSLMPSLLQGESEKHTELE